MNLSSDNLDTIFTNPLPLKDRTSFILHDGSSQPDSIKFISSPFASTVNVIYVPPKICRPKLKNNYKSMLYTDVD